MSEAMVIPLVGGASRLRHIENIYTSINDGRSMNISIEEWDEIRIHFETMFHGLGKVETSEEQLRFTSIEPYVATGISLSRQGKMAANMPLHNLDSTFHHVRFDDVLEALTLIGDGFNYTYRIPDEILAIKSDSD
tara:strand:+ start:49 stop:453 length:405 start_codon:yes stop_codon:yes gene_type:complete